jgi:malonyl-CoA O-methyltransferase
MEAALASRLGGLDGRLALTFEIIYGHALKPAPRVRMSGESAVSLADMRALLQAEKAPRG